MHLTNHIRTVLESRLDQSRVIVWYDGESAFGQFVLGLRIPGVQVVSAAQSALQARRQAETLYQLMEEAPNPAAAKAALLIYVPHARLRPEQRTEDPFEVFAAAGAVFGEAESEHLHSLARVAMPRLADQIDRLFDAGRPTLEQLDQLKLSSSYPLVEQALGSQAVVDVCTRLLGHSDTLGQIQALPGTMDELTVLLQRELGWNPPQAKPLEQWREPLATYVLVSELALDLEGPWPAALQNVPRASVERRERINAICERLRDSDATRETYMTLANQVEANLDLASHFREVADVGQRDTFSFEERQQLAGLTRAVQKGDLKQAGQILDARKTSVWRRQPERAQAWQVSERCLALLETAAGIHVAAGHTLARLVDAYVRSGGWSELDHVQRVLEQSWAESIECDELLPLVELARSSYREAIGRLQARFVKSVESEGWPPEGILRLTQVFDRFVAPALERREKVAYVLADSLRFEMGQALAAELQPLGDVAVQATAAALPTTTATGMAALLPGADGALSQRKVGEELIPHLGDHALPDLPARLAWLHSRYGDRVDDIALSGWLDSSEKKRAARVASVGLLILRVPDIDELPERLSARQARKYMGDLLGDLKVSCAQLARLGFQWIVLAADHGHVLLPEVLPGDVASAPPGQWALSKRRVKLGEAIKEQAGSLVLDARHLGIQGDVTSYCVPVGFSVYASDAVYFHEGLSLQECVVPVVTLRPRESPAVAGAGQRVALSYGRDHFTSQVIGLKVHDGRLFGDPLRVRVEAFDVANLKGPPVGEAADCTARDETTHEVTLLPNTSVEIPVLIDRSFQGEEVEVRVIAPDSGVIWATMRLKNRIMD